MSRPEPIEYAERLYAAIRDANFSPISFLAFGNAVKEGVPMRSMPRIAAEPFMRVVGEMLDIEEQAAAVDAALVAPPTQECIATGPSAEDAPSKTTDSASPPSLPPSAGDRRRTTTKRMP